jgi:hypothetical protein
LSSSEDQARKLAGSVDGSDALEKNDYKAAGETVLTEL